MKDFLGSQITCAHLLWCPFTANEGDMAILQRAAPCHPFPSFLFFFLWKQSVGVRGRNHDDKCQGLHMVPCGLHLFGISATEIVEILLKEMKISYDCNSSLKTPARRPSGTSNRACILCLWLNEHAWLQSRLARAQIQRLSSHIILCLSAPGPSSYLSRVNFTCTHVAGLLVRYHESQVCMLLWVTQRRKCSKS